MSNNSGGIGFAGVLTTVFITLKLTEVIDWSWWWVFSPIIISVGFVLVFLIGCALLIAWSESTGKKKRLK